MLQSIRATYENGVFKPAVPVEGLSDGQLVWITTAPTEDVSAIQLGIDDMNAGRVVEFAEVDRRIREKLKMPPHA